MPPSGFAICARCILYRRRAAGCVLWVSGQAHCAEGYGPWVLFRGLQYSLIVLGTAEYGLWNADCGRRSTPFGICIWAWRFGFVGEKSDKDHGFGPGESIILQQFRVMLQVNPLQFARELYL